MSEWFRFKQSQDVAAFLEGGKRPPFNIFPKIFDTFVIGAAVGVTLPIGCYVFVSLQLIWFALLSEK